MKRYSGGAQKRGNRSSHTESGSTKKDNNKRGAFRSESRSQARREEARPQASRSDSRPQPKGLSGARATRPKSGSDRTPQVSRDQARWVVGLHSCEEALKVRPHAIREIWLREDYASSQALRDIADLGARSRTPIRTKAVGQLDHVGSGHQGVALAVTEAPELNWASLASEGQKIVIALDGIEDPHNLGSMLRIAWLTGVTAILIPEDRAVGLTAAVCKVASGGAEHVPVDSHTNLPSALEKLKEIGFWIYGLSERGTQRPWDFKLPEKVVWVVGSEGSGMRVPTERACDELVRLPQVHTGSSYNASVALAMALSETCRQFGKPS